MYTILVPLYREAPVVPRLVAGISGLDFNARNRTAQSQTAGQGRRPNCSFPSQTTITNQQHPLARAILLYVGQVNSRRAELQSFTRPAQPSASPGSAGVPGVANSAPGASAR